MLLPAQSAISLNRGVQYCIPEARRKAPNNLALHRSSSTYLTISGSIALRISGKNVYWRRNTGREGLPWKLQFKSSGICRRKSCISAYSFHCAS
ncbi:uncharacterized protein MYCFIDRAFT_176505 [Pseudocercospora fijiensis CIRAD86]|uniref:Uncharacterized protein n=1 Tax=Pseudocercospora fijiensis (strain CIRAD86) TaxID=383855 RepID=M2ZQ61_PSEFD|nr:uncharacterized protein MYCFIDRAFT_176505 [Pseudocercospora fijiensis CIRAD86]EME81204.1 hypothetical protein MYCFIDRAFT_176505 [Pseudocercospora fijiensis CIRAD86]